MRKPQFGTTIIAACLAGLTSCSKPGINAGEDGGVAWIAMAVLLVVILVVLWLIIGREE